MRGRVDAVSIYGQQKLECEKLVRESGIDYMIKRPILMYGWNFSEKRGNPVTWIVDMLSKGKELNLGDDVYENPLFSDSAAEFIWKLIENNEPGVFHLAGKNMIYR